MNIHSETFEWFQLETSGRPMVAHWVLRSYQPEIHIHTLYLSDSKLSDMIWLTVLCFVNIAVEC